MSNFSSPPFEYMTTLEFAEKEIVTNKTAKNTIIPCLIIFSLLFMLLAHRARARIGDFKPYQLNEEVLVTAMDHLTEAIAEKRGRQSFPTLTEPNLVCKPFTSIVEKLDALRKQFQLLGLRRRFFDSRALEKSPHAIDVGDIVLG